MAKAGTFPRRKKARIRFEIPYISNPCISSKFLYQQPQCLRPTSRRDTNIKYLKSPCPSAAAESHLGSCAESLQISNHLASNCAKQPLGEVYGCRDLSVSSCKQACKDGTRRQLRQAKLKTEADRYLMFLHKSDVSNFKCLAISVDNSTSFLGRYGALYGEAYEIVDAADRACACAFEMGRGRYKR